MAEVRTEAVEHALHTQSDELTKSLPSISRREWLKASVGGGAGLALGSLLDIPTIRTAAQKLRSLK